MKTRLKLRPLKYGNGSYRLGLFTEEFQKFAKDANVSYLSIDFGDGCKNVRSIKTYIHYGSLTNKSLISTWLVNNGYTDSEMLLDFELIIDATTASHIFRLVK